MKITRQLHHKLLKENNIHILFRLYSMYSLYSIWSSISFSWALVLVLNTNAQVSRMHDFSVVWPWWKGSGFGSNKLCVLDLFLLHYMSRSLMPVLVLIFQVNKSPWKHQRDPGSGEHILLKTYTHTHKLNRKTKIAPLSSSPNNDNAAICWTFHFT